MKVCNCVCGQCGREMTTAPGPVWIYPPPRPDTRWYTTETDPNGRVLALKAA